jgi:hypothetical protein
MATGEPEPWTLGGIRARGMKLEAACLTADCRRFFVYELDAVIASLGADYPLPESGPGHACPHCGGDMKFQLAVWHPTDEAEA